MEKPERVARALCLARGFGPDAMVLPYKPVELGYKGAVFIEATSLIPVWQMFLKEAQWAIDELERSWIG